MIGQTPLRYFCGRLHNPPFRVRLVNYLGWHQELYRFVGETRVRRRWVRSRRPGRSIYTCRLPVTHWRATVKPSGLKWMNQVRVTRLTKRGHRPIFKFGKPTRVQVPTESWELGHRYEFTRWEETNR